jgi:hypothetical protein
MREWHSDGRGVVGKQEAKVKMENLEARDGEYSHFSILPPEL